MTFQRCLLWAILLVSLQLASCVGISAAMAQPVSSGGGQLIPDRASGMRIEINKGRLVRLDQPASSVFVADPDVADIQVKSPTLVYVFGKKSGETTIFAVDQNDKLLANIRIAVTHNLTGLEQALRDFLPDAYVKASTLGDAVVLSGVVRSAQQAEDARSLASRIAGGDANVINRIAVKGPNQINLRVRVAEVQRATLKQIGFNWDMLISAGSFQFGLATGNAVTTTGTFGDSTAVRRAINGSSTESIFGRVSQGNFDLNGVIDILESEGLVTVLAEPNLTTTSGETASFLAGGEFPVPIPQERDVITIDFKKFGVGLAFTPTLLNDGRVNLRVRPEVSQLSSTGEVRLNDFVIPGLTTRRAETTVELSSGQSFAIAGLIQNNVTHDIRRFPGLGDLPILGALFRSDGFRRNETELVIVITPYIVKPINDPLLAALPTDGLVMPNDAERIGRAPLYRQQQTVGQPTPTMTSGRRLVGTVGFTLE